MTIKIILISYIKFLNKFLTNLKIDKIDEKIDKILYQKKYKMEIYLI